MIFSVFVIRSVCMHALACAFMSFDAILMRFCVLLCACNCIHVFMCAIVCFGVRVLSFVRSPAVVSLCLLFWLVL